MFIPDGLMPLWQCMIYFLIVAISMILSLVLIVKRNEEIDFFRILILFIPLTIFAFFCMVFQIPIPYGTSVIVVVAFLIAILFDSPEFSFYLMALVMAFQAILFGCGGITTYGANLINIAIIPAFLGYYLFYYIRNKLGTYPSLAIASWISTVVPALTCSFELFLAGTFPLIAGLYNVFLYYAIAGIFVAIMNIVIIFTIEIFKSDFFKWNRTKS